MLEKLLKNKTVRRAVLPVTTLFTLLNPLETNAETKFTVFGKAGYFVPEGNELSEVYGSGPSYSGGIGVSGYYGSLRFGVDYFRKVGDWFSAYQRGVFFREDLYEEGNVRIIAPSVTGIVNLRGKNKRRPYAFIGAGGSVPNMQEEFSHQQSSDGFFYGSGSSLSDKISRSGGGVHGVAGIRRPFGDDSGAISGEIKYDSAKIGDIKIGGTTFSIVLEANF